MLFVLLGLGLLFGGRAVVQAVQKAGAPAPKQKLTAAGAGGDAPLPSAEKPHAQLDQHHGAPKPEVHFGDIGQVGKIAVHDDQAALDKKIIGDIPGAAQLFGALGFSLDVADNGAGLSPEQDRYVRGGDQYAKASGAIDAGGSGNLAAAQADVNARLNAAENRRGTKVLGAGPEGEEVGMNSRDRDSGGPQTKPLQPEPPPAVIEPVTPVAEMLPETFERPAIPGLGRAAPEPVVVVAPRPAQPDPAPQLDPQVQFNATRFRPRNSIPLKRGDS